MALTQALVQQLKTWAKQYNTKEFIANDPISFPHLFRKKKDIEIAGLLASWVAYGNRKAILRKLSELRATVGESPLRYIMEKRYKPFGNDAHSFYRFYKRDDFFQLCERLRFLYTQHESMESLVQTAAFPADALCAYFEGVRGIPFSKTSASKRMAMFLRWMVRNDGIVDFGLWKSVSPASLLIPLDTHVFNISKRIGLTHRATADKKAAMEITEALRHIWPNDPCVGDFALFGYGVNEKSAQEPTDTQATNSVSA